jgi:hypothetical protein
MSHYRIGIAFEELSAILRQRQGLRRLADFQLFAKLVEHMFGETSWTLPGIGEPNISGMLHPPGLRQCWVTQMTQQANECLT